jgi:hypothetical protein
MEIVLAHDGVPTLACMMVKVVLACGGGPTLALVTAEVLHDGQS